MIHENPTNPNPFVYVLSLIFFFKFKILRSWNFFFFQISNYRSYFPILAAYYENIVNFALSNQRGCKLLVHFSHKYVLQKNISMSRLKATLRSAIHYAALSGDENDFNLAQNQMPHS